MKSLKSIVKYFSAGEILLWCFSVVLIVASFCVFDRENYLTLAASLIGVTALIFNAKGNPAGQVLMIIFSLIYGYISFKFTYYGEMLTYVGMSMPMAVFALVSWLKNPYNGNKSEVKVNPSEKIRTHIHVDRNGCHNGDILLYSESFRHEKYHPGHHIGNDEFPCRISDIQKKSF